MLAYVKNGKGRQRLVGGDELAACQAAGWFVERWVDVEPAPAAPAQAEPAKPKRRAKAK